MILTCNVSRDSKYLMHLEMQCKPVNPSGFKLSTLSFSEKILTSSSTEACQNCEQNEGACYKISEPAVDGVGCYCPASRSGESCEKIHRKHNLVCGISKSPSYTPLFFSYNLVCHEYTSVVSDTPNSSLIHCV